jgi:hypothetical protein
MNSWERHRKSFAGQHEHDVPIHGNQHEVSAACNVSDDQHWHVHNCAIKNTRTSEAMESKIALEYASATISGALLCKLELI